MMILKDVHAAVAASHSHSHNHKSHSPSRERESDGAYSPRDTSHFSDENGHRSEFDHEAILGN